MNYTRRNTAVAGGLAAAGLVVALASLSAFGGLDFTQVWAMYAHDGMFDEAVEAEVAEKIGALEAERTAMLDGIGVSLPSLSAEEAAELRSRGADIFAKYAAAYAEGSNVEPSAIEALNAEYDALLAEFGAAPPQLSESQIQAITEYRDAENERFEQIYDAAYGEAPHSDLPGMSDEDVAALEAIAAEADAIAASFGLTDPEATVEQEMVLTARLAPLEPRYAEIEEALDALYAELDALDAQNNAIAKAAGLSFPDLSEEQWEDFERQMKPLEERSEEIYNRVYTSHE